MSFSSQLRLTSGLLAMAGVVALTSSGVRVATAQHATGASPSAAEAPAQADSGAAAPSSSESEQVGATSSVEGAMAELRGRIEKMPPPGYHPSLNTDDVIVLNGNGYNYAERRPSDFAAPPPAEAQGTKP